MTRQFAGRVYAGDLDVAAVKCLIVGPKAYLAASDGQEIAGATAVPRRDQGGQLDVAFICMERLL